MLMLVTVNNPRTPEGGWANEKEGCCVCGSICSAYFGIMDDSNKIHLFCLGCIHEHIERVHRTILKQCEKRV